MSPEQERPDTSSEGGGSGGSRLARFLVPAAILVAAVAAIALLVFPPGGGGLLSQWLAPKPNIVIIMTDDMGWNDVGFHLGDVQTPNIDKLAADGADLQGIYVQPLCTQTRAALLTGRYPFRYGLQHGVIRLESEYGLDLQEKLLSEALKEVGYGTYLVGKWHLGHHAPEYLPMARGFDYHYGNYCAGIDYFTHTYTGVMDWHRGNEPSFEEGYTTTLLTDEAVRIIQEHDPSRGSPLFLELAYTAPHTPVKVPPDAMQGIDPAEDTSRAQYKAAVAEIDKGVGQVLAALDAKQMMEDTLIVFMSDNGGEENNGADNKPYRGGKGNESVYDAGMRVPAVISWRNGKIQPGLVIREPLHVVDIHTTLLRIAGAKNPKLALDGVDLWKYLTGKKTPEVRELPLIISPQRQVIRLGDWKLIQGTLPGGPKKSKPRAAPVSKFEDFRAAAKAAGSGEEAPSKVGKAKAKAGAGTGSGEEAPPPTDDAAAGKTGKTGKASKAKTKTGKTKTGKAPEGGTTEGDDSTETQFHDDRYGGWGESAGVGGFGGGDAGSDDLLAQNGGGKAKGKTNSKSETTTESGKTGKAKTTTSARSGSATGSGVAEGSGSGGGSGGSGSGSGSATVVVELYNLSIDPAESVDLSDKERDKVKELQVIAAKYTAEAVEPLAEISTTPEQAPTVSADFKYPSILGDFRNQPATTPAPAQTDGTQTDGTQTDGSAAQPSAQPGSAVPKDGAP